MRIDVVSESANKVIDSITLSGDRITFHTGLAEEFFLIKRNHYGTNAETFQRLRGTSDGYTTFRDADQQGRVGPSGSLRDPI